jgi:hypothetical protein
MQEFDCFSKDKRLSNESQEINPKTGWGKRFQVSSRQ